MSVGNLILKIVGGLRTGISLTFFQCFSFLTLKGLFFINPRMITSTLLKMFRDVFFDS